MARWMATRTVMMLIATAATTAPLLVSTVHGHSYLVKPRARDDFYHRDDNNTMGCPSNFRSTPTSYAAGETIDVRYWRNNHNGGFIRWALVPLGQPETKEAFDKNVFFYTCRESGPECTPRGKPARHKLDLDTELGDKIISCGDTITLPDYLPAGDYVLQWTIYGAGWSYGNRGWAEMIWKSCADIRLTTSGAKSKPACPSFTGGDRVTALESKGTDVCFYYWSNAVPNVWYKGDNAMAEQGYKFDAPAEWKQCRDNKDGSVGKEDESPASSPPPPPPPPAPAPTTTTTKPKSTPSPSAGTTSTFTPKTNAPPSPPSATPQPTNTKSPSTKCGVRL